MSEKFTDEELRQFLEDEIDEQFENEVQKEIEQNELALVEEEPLIPVGVIKQTISPKDIEVKEPPSDILVKIDQTLPDATIKEKVETKEEKKRIRDTNTVESFLNMDLTTPKTQTDIILKPTQQERVIDLKNIQSEILKPVTVEQVQTRPGPSGKELFFVDVPKLIDQAIRLFGPGGYSIKTNETVMRYQQKNEKGQWHVVFTATVGVFVKPLNSIYEGSGSGEGIDKSLAEATDRAIKIAETEATKRAFRLIGPTFGLSLYDKSAITKLEQEVRIAKRLKK